MKKKRRRKGFIIGGCDTIITEKHSAEPKLNFLVISGSARVSGSSQQPALGQKI